MYFPMMGFSFLFVAAGMSLGSVMMEWASTEPHLQARAAGTRGTASRMTFCTFSMLRARYSITWWPVTASCSACCPMRRRESR